MANELSSNLSRAYLQAARSIKSLILKGQYEAAKDINRVQLLTNYTIGKYISLNTRNGSWGSGALESISSNIQRMMPGLRGYSPESLKLMRKFYEEWRVLDCNPIADDNLNSVIAITELQNPDTENLFVSNLNFPNLAKFPLEDFFRVPFTHHVRIVGKIKDTDERFYYIRRVAEEHLSVERLLSLMAENAFRHQNTIPNNFQANIPKPEIARKAVMMFKDQYLLNFINTEELGERDSDDIDERVIEQSIVNNIKNFILAFGKDFAFVGNQYRLEAYGVEHFPDLLFFNRELNALVCVELKSGEFKSSYLGQLTTYLRLLDDNVRKPHENPSIGIVLCKSANREYVEYIIQDYEKPMGVATYITSAEMPETLQGVLPDIDELKKLL